MAAPVATILQRGSTAQERRGYIAEAPVPLIGETLSYTSNIGGSTKEHLTYQAQELGQE
jgi:hypothetical protein